jgi:hypothetical protein
MALRGIDRHNLIAYFFLPTRVGTLYRKRRPLRQYQQARKDYFADRFVIELALAIAKAKGFVDLREIQRGRAGRIFQFLLQVNPRAHERIESYLKAFEMGHCDASRESYRYLTLNSSSHLTLDNNTFVDRMREDLIVACEKLLTEHRKRRFSQEGRRLLEACLDAMFRGEDVEITRAKTADFFI